jgi:site-specific DNA recombinase
LNEKNREPGSINRAPAWRTALYIRLSKEDGDREESDSILNQRQLLRDFVEESGDLALAGCYVDDGWSGTSFERPGFQRMMADIRTGKVNCVAVKDLSRFGRDYIETGRYLEQIFPFLKVRFISLSDGLDSYRNPSQMDGLLVPFKNLLNDAYSRDISAKIRRVLDMKRRRGEFIGAFAAFGYRKDPADGRRLLPDPAAAGIVREIFRRYLAGMSKAAIAQALNKEGIPSPSAYRQLSGQSPPSEAAPALWSPRSVSAILQNPVYTGVIAQGKSRAVSYKIHKQVRLPKEEWILVEAAHPPIVSQEIFQQAARLQACRTRAAPENGQLYLFAGLLRCADCRKAMHRQRAKGYIYYQCRTYKEASKSACSKHSLRADRLEGAVLAALQMLAARFCQPQAILSALSRRSPSTGFSAGSASGWQEQERSRLRRYLQTLYEDWKDGDLSKEEYRRMKEEYSGRLEQLDRLAQRLQAAEEEAHRPAVPPLLEGFRQTGTLTGLTRELLLALIEEIEVCEGQRIILHLKIRDPFLPNGKENAPRRLSSAPAEER